MAGEQDQTPQDQSSQAQQPTPDKQDRQADPHQGDINRNDPNNPTEPNRVGLFRESRSPAQGIDTGAITPGRSSDGSAKPI